jgi:hypothetical protein
MGVMLFFFTVTLVRLFFFPSLFVFHHARIFLSFKFGILWVNIKQEVVHQTSEVYSGLGVSSQFQ